ncbi:hypothetical protein P879_01948 [Paragonimus westermani]|uniref:Ionotropic glutamate receptor C-terminal domain-containing protein n=1 Tax=Paragonimus westermani TaxID=34504 RepID=A0A8T0DSQ8_9TREM|nr:hypothetical protein P879_01948 [Paragonimus westermani]
MVPCQRIDLAVAYLTITETRSNVVTFLGPFMNAYLKTLIAYPPEESSMFQIYKPFTASVWLTTGLAVLMVGVAVCLLNKASPSSALNQQLPVTSSDNVSFVENIWVTFKCTLHQTNTLFPKASSTRVFVLAFWFLVLIWHSTWQANMTAFFSKRNPIVPIKSLREITQQDLIRPFFVNGSSVHTFFHQAEFNPVLVKIYKMVLETGFTVNSNREGVEAVRCNSNLAFISDYYLLLKKIASSCDEFLLLDEVVDKSPASFATRKNETYAKIFTNYLLNLSERGVIDRLFLKWLPKKERCLNKENGYAPLEVEAVGGGLFPMLLCAIASLIVLGLERAWYRFGSQFRQRIHRWCNKQQTSAKVPELDSQPDEEVRSKEIVISETRQTP